MTIILFVLALGATARLTRLFNADVLAGPVRAAVMARYGDDSGLGILVRCPWCLSPYVAAAVLGSGWWSTNGHGQPADWWTFGAAVLTISYAYAVFAQWADDE